MLRTLTSSGIDKLDNGSLLCWLVTSPGACRHLSLADRHRIGLAEVRVQAVPADRATHTIHLFDGRLMDRATAGECPGVLLATVVRVTSVSPGRRW